MVGPVAGEMLPGPVMLQLMVALELVRVALMGIAAPPTSTVALIGVRLRVGEGVMVMVAVAVSAPALAVKVAVFAVRVVGGV